MKDRMEIRAVYDDGRTVKDRDGSLEVSTVLERSGTDFLEYHAVVRNHSGKTVHLSKVEMLHITDPAEYGAGTAPYDIYRSGRHKNDMPGVFTSGIQDERFADVSSVMAESGDGMEGTACTEVVSDHLTIIKGSGGKHLVIEFLTGRDQLFDTTLKLDVEGGLQEICSAVRFGIDLGPGESRVTETIRVVLTDDADAEVQEFARRKAAECGSRNGRHPAVFCTWYYYGLTVTYEDVKTCLAVMQQRKLPYDVFQVDEGWEVTLGEYRPNDKFPVAMKDLAQEIRDAGYMPGLWSSPFVAHETATIWQAHPEWILRDKSGKPCLFPMNDTVYYVFDITDPGTWEYFTSLYRQFTYDWGYTYHKLDFTRAAVIYEDADFHDRSITLAQAYYRAVAAIREGMGEDAFFLMCGGLYDPVIGLVDAQRTGSDVLSMWSSTVNKGGKTAPYTIRQSLLRSYMNAWWANDPDALMIRVNEVMERGQRLTYGLLNDEEVKTSVINQFAGGGIMCQTEPLDRISEERLMEIRHILPVVKTQVRTGGLMRPERFPEEARVYVEGTGALCICRINWSDTEEKPVTIDLSELHLPEGTYAVCDFYAGIYKTGVGAGETVALGTLQPHGATVIKVERIAERPVILASDGHYSMGGECDALEIREGKLVVGRKNILPVATHYRILLPEPWRYREGQTVEVTIGPDACEEVLQLDPEV